MANKVYYSKTTLIGGAATALDYIDGSLLVDGDFAYVTVADVLYTYKLNASSGAAETSPWIIAPDTNAGNKRWILQFPAKGIAQVVNYTTGALASGNTTMPIDDTIPQNTEGNEYLSLAITPKNTTNILIIDVSIYLSPAATRYTGVALFQDAMAGALAASLTYAVGASPVPFRLLHYMVAGTIATTTFKVRGGSAGGDVCTLNGYGAARYFGGVFKSSITITELVP